MFDWVLDMLLNSRDRSFSTCAYYSEKINISDFVIRTRASTVQKFDKKFSEIAVGVFRFL